MKDYLIMEYELNEKYHDTKEKTIWVAFSLFYTFSLLQISFFLEIDKCKILHFSGKIITVANITIFFLASFFISQQVKMKCISVFKNQKIRQIIANNNDNEIKIWFRKDQKILNTELINDNKTDIISTIRIEISLFLIMLICFFGNLSTIIIFFNFIDITQFPLYFFYFSSILYYIILIIIETFRT